MAALQGHHQIFYTTVGIVQDTNDPAQMGRVRVYCPSIDHEDYTIDDLPWAQYLSPVGGTIKNMHAGPNEDISYGPTAYGFWGIPKLGATVLIQFVNGDPNYRVWTGCIYPLQGQRGLPGGRGADITQPPATRPLGPFSDSYEPILPGKANQAEAGLDSNYYYTRGGYERQVAQATTNKDGTEGYSANINRTDPTDLDSQTYSWTSPGHHFISMQDAPQFCRMRFKTTTGHQIILDDTNERIYISTSVGNSWLEMDKDGHVQVYAAQSLSFTTGGDFNVTATGSFAVQAASIQMTGSSGVAITSGVDVNINSGCATLVTAGDNIELGSGANIIQQGTQIHLNSMGTTAAAVAAKPALAPTHEPWTRPAAVGVTRNKYWQP
jgi:hypothetical protein